MVSQIALPGVIFHVLGLADLCSVNLHYRSLPPWRHNALSSVLRIDLQDRTAWSQMQGFAQAWASPAEALLPGPRGLCLRAFVWRVCGMRQLGYSFALWRKAFHHSRQIQIACRTGPMSFRHAEA